LKNAVHPRATQLIDQLGMQPHPEGGFYRELYRSSLQVQPDDDRPARAALTTIYFLLPEGMHSRWHRVASDEVWHLYEGWALELLQATPDGGSIEQILLGSASNASGPVHVVPAGHWQAARPLGPYALTGCTVAPGFDFADFSFLRDAPEALARVRLADPLLADLA
jgi:predicted cupin superfamily sugar epimerase